MHKIVLACAVAGLTVLGCQSEMEPVIQESITKPIAAKNVPLFDPIGSAQRSSPLTPAQREALLAKAAKAPASEAVQLIVVYASTLNLIEGRGTLGRKASAILQMQRPESEFSRDERLLIQEMYGHPPDRLPVGHGTPPSIGNSRFLALIYAQKRGLPASQNNFALDELDLAASMAVSMAETEDQIRGEKAYWSFIKDLFLLRNPEFKRETEST